MTTPILTQANLFKILRQAITTLSDRFLTILTFLVASGFGVYSLISPDYHRDAITLYFGILYLLTLKRERTQHGLQGIRTEGSDTDA